MALSYVINRWESLTGAGREIDWQREFSIYGISCCTWVVLTPMMLYLCHRFRFDRGRRLPILTLHVLAGLALGAAKVAITCAGFRYIIDFEVPWWSLGSTLLGLLTYLTFLAIYSGIIYYLEYRDREIRASHLESQLARAELEVLKRQLHPHFLFNTLNTIASLNHHDVKTANRMISRLSDLLRLSLEHIAPHEVPLAKEIEFLDLYLDIEKIRFDGRLEVRMEISKEALDAYVPNLILQPIVENAVRHGIARIDSKGIIQLRGARQEDRLCIEVEDNGPGMPGDPDRTTRRVGLTNTQARLKHMYGDQAGMTIDASSNGGCIAGLVLPFHTEQVARFSGSDHEKGED
jgi:hypothetical protein